MSLFARSSIRTSAAAFAARRTLPNALARNYTMSSITSETITPSIERRSPLERRRRPEHALCKSNTSFLATGIFQSNGRTFDSSRERGMPFEFKLGAGQVIRGWDQGLQGMGVGERRKITLPPAYAYGPRGYPLPFHPTHTCVRR
ncbi:FKBP-type peptidyl-prolyl cis-trans isomerase [Rhizoctonia solani]|uniref:peptidylprolyl isomerase n=1 Tax=Rhizoctonia solani TaxID=456999 RepID=A0A8H8P571_9AGAM|nr:FKBP-type peptidyl-prolyl cis-trans isomerase [Rhizoctonia solani]QRW24038.1 FKBP-type peptidyl-prolyl cis-trans isomerase [Rhizoctonia solani]